MANIDELLTTREAARLCGLAASTLAKIRCMSNSGCPYVKLGSKVLYRRGDLESWIAGRLTSSTSAAANLPRRLTNNVASAA